MKRRIVGNPDVVARLVADIIDNEERACAQHFTASEAVIAARRLVAFNMIWEIVSEHTVGYEG